MKKWLLGLVAGLFSLCAGAQEYPELGAKLEEYFTALSGESAAVQNAECDFLIESCKDSLVRQFVTLKIYDHYLRSKIMGDDAVAVHVAQKWLLSGAVKMHSEEDLMNADIYVTFNKSSLIGAQAPLLTLKDPSGKAVKVPAAGKYSVLYFYSTDCPTCKAESAALEELAVSGTYPVSIFAVNVGDDAAAWKAYRPQLLGVRHVWDPEMKSDWQMKYGVLKTPWMLLVSPSGEILGRGLDTPSLKMLLAREFSTGAYQYGEKAQMARYEQLFAAYGDTLKPAHVLDVADYMAARTIGEGNMDAFKQVEGDLLYYLSNQRTEAYRDAVIPFVNRYIRMPDVWTTEEDRLQVVSLGDFMAELAARTPVGSEVPDLTVPGTLRRHKCLFVRDGKTGRYALRKLKGHPGYVVFYSAGCTSCKETLEAVDRLVKENARARVLLVDMDALMSDEPELATTLLNTFDLTVMPYVIELDKKGVIRHRYVKL